MAGIPENKARIAITLGKELLARLDEYCDRTGMTRSAYISYAVAHQLDAESRMMDYTQGAIAKLFQQVAEQEGYTLQDFDPRKV